MWQTPLCVSVTMLKWKKAGCLTCKWDEREGEVREITQCHINKCSFHDGVLNAECESTAAASRSVAFTSANSEWSQRDQFRWRKKKYVYHWLIILSHWHMACDHPSTVWPCECKWTIRSGRNYLTISPVDFVGA